MQIQKYYRITKWSKYEEVALIGDVSGLQLQPNYGTVNTTGGHFVNFQTWLNDDTGDGWEIRTFIVNE